MIRRRAARAGVLICAIWAAGLADAMPARASCNQIPGTVNSFRGARGAVDRPFAEPGDIVEVRLSEQCDRRFEFQSPRACHAHRTVVTLAFKAPNGRRDMLFLATDCRALDLDACRTTPGVQTVSCNDVTASCPGSGSGAPEIEVRGQRRLRFRFPDTDALLDGESDDRTFTGPLTIAVTSAGDRLPCGLAERSCADALGTPPQLLACVDALSAPSDTCDGPPHDTFPSFTALPPANDYQALCVDPSPPCTAAASEVRFALDAAGNVFLPMDWLGILIGEQVPVARLLRGATSVEAFPGSGRPIAIPAQGFLASFSPQGGRLPPIFEPQFTPSEQLTLFGTADASRTVLRLARRSASFEQCDGGADDGLPCLGLEDECPGGTCGPATCAGGANDGLACTHDGACPGGECGPALFDFRSRLHLGVGPVLIPRAGPGLCRGGTNAGATCDADDDCPGSECVQYRLEAKDPVPLDALRGTKELFAFVVPELIGGLDLNGDGDATDDVIQLVDRKTGAVRAIGTTPTGIGRATARVRQPPFSFPAVVAEGNVVAFLESEPLEGARDANGDGDVFDTLLRVFAVSDQGATELTQGLALTADAAPLIGGASLAASDGLVVFRLPEWSAARVITALVSAAPDGRPGNGASGLSSIASDGLRVAFESQAGNLHPNDGNGTTDVFVRDLRSARTALASANASRTGAGNFASSAPAISADGATVVFQSRATDLLASDANAVMEDILAAAVSFADPLLLAPTLASVSSSGVQAGLWSFHPSVSGDGRFVAFESLATLVSDVPDSKRNIYVRDRVDGSVARMTVALDRRGIIEKTDGSSFAPVISADGRSVAFETVAENLTTKGPRKIVLRDRATPAIEDVSITTLGGPANWLSSHPSIAADGGAIAFASAASNLVAGDTNGAVDAFVRDRDGARTVRVSVSSEGRPALGPVGGAHPSLSPDGRYVAFASPSAELVRGDTNGDWDVFVHDLGTGATTRASVGADGAQGNGYSVRPAISAEGRYVAFETAASNLTQGDDNGVSDVVIRGPDAGDVRADLSGDGDVVDTMLAVLDNGQLRRLCPAGDVAVSGDMLAFLRPEGAGAAADCPAGPDLNGDGDAADAVVHRWKRGQAVANLRCAARAVALSPDITAALVPEAAQASADLNGDGDTDDTIVKVLGAAASPATCGDWVTPTVAGRAVAGEIVQVAGRFAGFLAAESPAGGPLNGSDLRPYRILHIYDMESGELVTAAGAVEDFVMGESAVAFRVRESAHGLSLNNDGDALDDVLFVYSLAAKCFLNTQQAVTPCRLEACDPRVPYRVGKDTVTYLTIESLQGGSDGAGTDLNEDGDAADLILRFFNVRQAESQSAACVSGSGAAAGPLTLSSSKGTPSVLDLPPDAASTLGALSTGICATSGEACAFDPARPSTSGDCSGTCFVPPGRCVAPTGARCAVNAVECSDTDLDDDIDPCPDLLVCPAGHVCRPSADVDAGGICEQELAVSCRFDADCAVHGAAARCLDRAASTRRLFNPLAPESANAQVFPSAGRCLAELEATCGAAKPACESGTFCGAAGTCVRDLGSCGASGGCPTGSVCRKDLVTAAASDSDGDEIIDPFDNCPAEANVMQEDRDGDGLGDACDSPAACSAAAARNPCLPGGGTRAVDCQLEWVVRPAPEPPASGLPKANIVCYEGDPHCDASPRANDGACTMRVGLCINNDDPRLRPECIPSDIAAFAVKRPDPLHPADATDTANAAVLEYLAGVGLGLHVVRDTGPISIAPPNSAADRCSGLRDIHVPLRKTRGGKLRRDTRVLRVRTTSSGGASDGDDLRLECRPSTCGNGETESHETCDDGNRVAGDGCNQGCLLE